MSAIIRSFSESQKFNNVAALEIVIWGHLQLSFIENCKKKNTSLFYFGTTIAREAISVRPQVDYAVVCFTSFSMSGGL